MSSNLSAARSVIDSIRALGVSDFCVCSGSRNAPLLAVLATIPDVRLHTFVDERGAAFFAVGAARRLNRPVCVVTTSGTAVAELLPAAIEAWYSGTPLILLTADRPARYRGTGAPQSIEQESIFGGYAARSVETWNGASPLHLNIEFDEPLIDDAVGIKDEETQTGGSGPYQFRQRVAASQDSSPVVIDFRRPLVLLGGLRDAHRDRVLRFATKLNAPVYAEPLSGLREEPELQPLLIRNERTLARGSFDGVLRIGDIPTLRFWRDLEEKNPLPIISFSRLPFAGLTRGEVHPIEALPDASARDLDGALLREDAQMHDRWQTILEGEPHSELAMFREMSLRFSNGSRVYLGNSLPIREWDLAATREPRGFHYGANRGANGIDGQLSTFFGWCQEGADNVAVVGDLTALYDLNAPWIVPQLGASFRIVIVNNDGGRIFERVPSLRALSDEVRNRVIENSHGLRFHSWSAMFGIEDRVEELRPDLEASRRVWKRYDELWS
ncbi:MAG: thiamine pyrophosphate-binding protein [Thermoanaerobaculia bacterium]